MLKVCVLGSGSGGNCAYVEAGGYKLLIDAARLGQRYIKNCLAGVGASIEEIDAIVATHLHGDHVDSSVTLPLCRNFGIPLYIHSDSIGELMERNRRFQEIDNLGLLRGFGDDGFDPLPDVSIRPFHVQHGGGGWSRDMPGRPVGFRVSHSDNGESRTLAYTTDLGVAGSRIASELAGADVIVIESNHDIEMEKKSSRPRFLVDWVLSPWGHLSNIQAASTLAEAVSLAPGAVSHVVLAHLSRDCNDPELAVAAAAEALQGAGDIEIHVASQKSPTPLISV